MLERELAMNAARTAPPGMNLFSARQFDNTLAELSEANPPPYEIFIALGQAKNITFGGRGIEAGRGDGGLGSAGEAARGAKAPLVMEWRACGRVPNGNIRKMMGV